MRFQDKIKDVIGLFDNWLSDPQDDTQLDQWQDAAELIIDSYDFSIVEQHYMDRLVDIYLEQHQKRINWHQRNTSISSIQTSHLDELLNRKQLEQRTTEWYQQMATVISASELGKLFGSIRERAKLVLSKTVPYPERNQQLAVLSDAMSAFDWGIRFEPVVKQIYEYRYGTTLKELGRLSHPTYHRCTASPDGLVYSCPLQQRTGRLIEIKCPVTREIDGTIPKDYYDQIQMQLHVTGLHTCDYVEAVFSSRYHTMSIKEGPGLYEGSIALIRYAELKGNQEFYYAYGPVNADPSWLPEIKEGEEVVEIIPWRLHQWGEQIVKRNEEWWVALQPIMETFWEDVEKAKRGEFTVPESSRPPRAPKVDTCMIQFHKLDENGNPV